MEWLNRSPAYELSRQERLQDLRRDGRQHGGGEPATPASTAALVPSSARSDCDDPDTALQAESSERNASDGQGNRGPPRRYEV